MKIEFVKKRSLNKYVIKNIASMIEFACKFYLPKSLLKDLYVEVIFDRTLENCGECSPTVDCKFPNSFEIYLDPREYKKDKDEFYRTVFHECVHLKQYALDEMYDCAKSTVFKGKRFIDKSSSISPKDKLLTPWEIEAYGSELGLLRQWEWTNEYAELE